MGPIRVQRWRWIAWLLLAVLIPTFSALARDAGEVVSVVGKAEVLREGRWQPLRIGEVLAVGATVKTAEDGRIAVQLVNGSQLKLNANSRLELRQLGPRQGLAPTAIQRLKNLLRLLQGEVWIRGDDESLEIQTAPATATIRGTEFNLAVHPVTGARLAVLEGLIEFGNPQGSVLVAANEQATAQVGQAPRKTVLLDPLDAVQWSLYYPGTVSYRDYSLADDAGFHASPPSRNRRTVSAEGTEEWVRRGEASFAAGAREQARHAFTQALEIEADHPRARAGLGWTLLAAGQPEAALREFRRIRPPTLMASVGAANALYCSNRLAEADRVIAEARQRFPGAALPWVQAARNDLILGRAAEAQQAIDQALARDPRSALALSLRSTIYLTQNRRDRARQAAEQAVAADPHSVAAQLSLSLVQQAESDLAAALETARKAVALDPDHPQALIQESRLLFGMGRLQEAAEAASRARQGAPDDALVNSTLGFLHLAQGRLQRAEQAFERAIAQDSTLGEPHLGLGLTLFRRNRTDAAVTALQKAVLLEPKVSLYNSYLGKAYYETQDDRLAQKYLEAAKRLDPRDPTPHFYDAIRQQSVNRPVEAVRNMQTSIALNDNRAVYRSQLLLDEDLAARDAALGKIYNEVGFGRLGLQEGWKSVGRDPTNHSAHRLLADSYAALPGVETARASELLQAQLLQPMNITPVSPQMAETKLLIPSAGPITPSLYEFNPLFARNRPTLFFSGLGGNEKTWGDELIVSGLTDHFSYSFGQFHHQSDGYRANNDLENNLYNLFVQAAPTPDINVQAEYRHRETTGGDLDSQFDGAFSASRRRGVEQDTARVGARYSWSPRITAIASVIHTDRESVVSSTLSDFKLGLNSKGTQAETQLLYKQDQFNLTTGLGAYSLDVTLSGQAGSDSTQRIAYGYANIKIPATAIWTLGLSHESDEDNSARLNELNPKFGVQWALNDQVALRAAAFKTVKRTFALEQTIEPTQVAGFNQFFDETDLTVSRNLGLGLDVRFNGRLFGGLEALRRDVRVPLGTLQAPEFYEILSNQESAYSAYLYWLPNQNWALSGALSHKGFEADKNCVGCLFLYPAELKTFSLPLSVQYFDPSGFFGGLSLTYVNQDIQLLDPASSVLAPTKNEEFTVVNANLGYRLPNRQGLVALQINNVFDEKFHYQDDSFKTGDGTANPLYIPERTIMSQLILKF